MFKLLKDFRLTFVGGLAILAAALSADVIQAAGLVGYRNDTNQVVVVQSTVTSNGTVRRSKPQTLYPGESALDGLAFTGTRRIVVYDAKKPNVVLFQGDVTNVDDAFYSVQLKEATVPVKGQPPAPPQLELVKVKAAAMPRPGQPTPPKRK